jgi:hypothetical protein
LFVEYVRKKKSSSDGIKVEIGGESNHDAVQRDATAKQQPAPAREVKSQQEVEAEKAEAERIAAEKAEAERIAAEKAEVERIAAAAEKAEAERIAQGHNINRDDITRETEKDKYKNILTSYIQKNNKEYDGNIFIHLNNLNQKSVEFIREVLESVKGTERSGGFSANLQTLNSRIHEYDDFLKSNNNQDKNNNIKEILESMTTPKLNKLNPITPP